MRPSHSRHLTIRQNEVYQDHPLPRFLFRPYCCCRRQSRTPLPFQPMPLLKRAAPFDDPEWLFELKYNGFRALAVIEHDRAQLLSRNGHPFASFSALAESISDLLPNARAVIDGEICSLDTWQTTVQKSDVPPWEPAVLLCIRFVDL